MLSIKSAVVTALQTSTALATLLGAGTRIFYKKPDVKSTNIFPRITYFEIDNTGSLYADNQEIASAILYQIDLWSTRTASLTETAIEVDSIMTGLDFRRLAAPDLDDPDPNINHKAMRFRNDYEDPTF
jgi:hypothetical protein